MEKLRLSFRVDFFRDEKEKQPFKRKSENERRKRTAAAR
jgi:hypothetical protein